MLLSALLLPALALVALAAAAVTATTAATPGFILAGGPLLSHSQRRQQRWWSTLPIGPGATAATAASSKPTVTLDRRRLGGGVCGDGGFPLPLLTAARGMGGAEGEEEEEFVPPEERGEEEEEGRDPRAPFYDLNVYEVRCWCCWCRFLKMREGGWGVCGCGWVGVWIAYGGRWPLVSRSWHAERPHTLPYNTHTHTLPYNTPQHPHPPIRPTPSKTSQTNQPTTKQNKTKQNKTTNGISCARRAGCGDSGRAPACASSI
jgi:hypothetical protein